MMPTKKTVKTDPKRARKNERVKGADTEVEGWSSDELSRQSAYEGPTEVKEKMEEGRKSKVRQR
jgi:hypothetical protein